MKKAVVFVVLAAAPILAAGAPAAASPHPTVAFNWWKGVHEQRHFYASVRPSAWGSSFGEPITSMHWVYWHRNAAEGKGLLIHMSCQPCHETIYLHDVKSSHGIRYFEKAREVGPYTVSLHWTGRDWTG